MTPMLEKLKEAKAIMDGDRDNLLKAIVMLAELGQMNILPGSDNFMLKPVIILPQPLYDRLIEIAKVEDDVE